MDWNSTVINKPDLSVYATNTNLNNISTNSKLSINNHTTSISNLNTTSTTIFNNLNSLSSYSYLNINNISKFSALNISNLTISSNNKQDTYTPERQYPPKLYDTIDAATTSITYNGFTAYKLNFTLNSTGITYGIGDYTLTFSNRFTIGGNRIRSVAIEII